MFMCYYTRGNTIYFSIIDDTNKRDQVNGSDNLANLHNIAETYNVKLIERID